jgi:NAD(P)-dependent dehydrogenase (short-subunit alcohol dehydrogenase family)
MFDPGFIGENVEMDIKGSALVTGASRGIGRAVAIALADRGFDTVATMRNPADGSQLAEETSGQLDVRRLDVTDPVTFEIPGDLQVLVNNAGIDTDYLPVEHSDLDDWRSIFETNVVGVVAMTKAAIPALRASRPSVICNITSSSIIASVPFYAAYRASKAAVSAFDDSLRVEVAGFGIRVVEILPGPIDTDMFQLSAGELPAARFDRYRAMAEVSTRQRTEYADPHVSDPAVAASLIVDAILDDGGPMRYGCDPLSVGMLDLWRQADDEAIYALTGKPILDEVTQLGRQRAT